jgi:hypothetical protein
MGLAKADMEKQFRRSTFLSLAKAGSLRARNPQVDRVLHAGIAICLSGQLSKAGMKNSKKSKMTWFTAFKVLSMDKSPAIGKYPDGNLRFCILQLSLQSPFCMFREVE